MSNSLEKLDDSLEEIINSIPEDDKPIIEQFLVNNLKNYNNNREQVITNLDAIAEKYNVSEIYLLITELNQKTIDQYVEGIIEFGKNKLKEKLGDRYKNAFKGREPFELINIFNIFESPDIKSLYERIIDLKDENIIDENEFTAYDKEIKKIGIILEQSQETLSKIDTSKIKEIDIVARLIDNQIKLTRIMSRTEDFTKYISLVERYIQLKPGDIFSYKGKDHHSTDKLATLISVGERFPNKVKLKYFMKLENACSQIFSEEQKNMNRDYQKILATTIDLIDEYESISYKLEKLELRQKYLNLKTKLTTPKFTQPKRVKYSNDIKIEIQNNADKGLDFTLNLLIAHANRIGDYSTSVNAEIERLKKQFQNSQLSEEETQKEINKIKPDLWKEAAKKYLGKNELILASKMYENAEDYKSAAELLIKEGSSESVDNAIRILINQDINPKLGIKFYLDKGEYNYAANSIREKEYKYAYQEEKRKYFQEMADLFIIRMHEDMIIKCKAKLKEKDIEIPKEFTLISLINLGDIYIYKDSYSMPFSNITNWIDRSEDPEIIRKGIEIYDFLIQKEDEKFYEDNKMMLKSKIGHEEKAIEYFIKKIEENTEKYHKNKYLQHINDICKKTNQIDRAIKINEKNGEQPIELYRLKKDYQKIADTYKGSNNPIMFCKALEELRDSRLTKEKDQTPFS